MALAAETSDRPTMLGTRALRVEPSQPLRAAATEGRMNKGHSDGPRSAFKASPALLSAINDSTANSKRRRSTASATEPPNTDPTISGTSWVRETRPTSNDECVRR